MNSRFFMFGFIVLALALVGIYAKKYIDRKASSEAVVQTMARINMLTTAVESNRQAGYQFNTNQFNVDEFKAPVVEDLILDPTGIIKVKFQASVNAIGGHWIFIIPAIRGTGESFSYLDMSQPNYDMFYPMIWVCGVMQKTYRDIEYMPPQCNNILGPEFVAP